MTVIQSWRRTSQVFCVFVLTTIVVQVASLSGPNVCMVQQKYNITKRVKYRAPMSVRTYEWCFSMPPRCSRWKTEMRDLTRLETEERMAEVAVCCPGYKMKDVSCIPICPNGKTGSRCTEECPPNKWGPNCVHDCAKCLKGFCSPITGLCECLEGWQGESCNIRMTTTPPPALMEELLTTTKSTIQTVPSPSTKQTETVKSTTAFDTKRTSSTVRTWKPVNITTTSKPTSSVFSETMTIATKANTSEVSNMTTISYINNMNKTRESINTTLKSLSTHSYNRTESSIEGTSNILPTEHVSTTTVKIPLITKIISTQKSLITTTPALSTISTISTTKISPTNLTVLPTTTEITKTLDTLANSNSTLTKIKVKEIWIKPTQKGTSTEFKIKVNHDLSHSRINGTKNEIASEVTTPRTIIVSIIPTSVSHASFKKIALTTASYFPLKTNSTARKQIHGDADRTEPGFTKSMTLETVSTQAPFTIKILTSLQRNVSNSIHVKNTTKLIHKTPRKTVFNNSSSNISTSKANIVLTTQTSTIKSTNRMSSIPNTSTIKQAFKTSITTIRPSTNISSKITTKRTVYLKDETKYLKDDIFKTPGSLATTTVKSVTTKVDVVLSKTSNSTNRNIKNGVKNVTKAISNILSTETPSEDEMFHILTEPEHITAVMTDKERERSSLDLISIVSVAGGIMMAIITVAVIIVMFERCRRPRYEDVRKINDIRMQVMIDNNDVPPPYVRSIFHTPLPDPPQSEKCHYQPISTLDRNLKQFMRPVVVQNISPIMLENFRGILECHYDHLPRRSHDIGINERSSLASSIGYDSKPIIQRTHSVAESAVTALECEAKLHCIENESSEPLYAEIPFWRPPSEHAVEIMNMNGEAVTEL